MLWILGKYVLPKAKYPWNSFATPPAVSTIILNELRLNEFIS
jgi:hypothetical protein